MRRLFSSTNDVPVLPNVKDEPRPRPARLLQASIGQPVVSFDSTYVSRRRDGRGRWLWRLVRRLSPLRCHRCMTIGMSSLLGIVRRRAAGENYFVLGLAGMLGERAS